MGTALGLNFLLKYSVSIPKSIFLIHRERMKKVKTTSVATYYYIKPVGSAARKKIYWYNRFTDEKNLFLKNNTIEKNKTDE